jgi:FlaA1/EpsC-like NDP-sugar epimerase
VGTDIEIRFSGTRPGEKLYEELFFDSESALPTDHPKVLRAKNGALPAGLGTVVDLLVDGARRGWSDEQLRSVMGRLVPELKVTEAEVETEVEVEAVRR